MECIAAYSGKTLLFYPEYGNIKFLQRVINLLPHYNASHPENGNLLQLQLIQNMHVNITQTFLHST
jgi:hypothetical protein